jgi:hypothetical protein
LCGCRDDDGDGVGEGPIDCGSDDGSDEKLDDSDFLSQLLHDTKAELMVGTTKGLANFETVKNQRRKIYTSDRRDVPNTGPCFISYLSC